MSETPASKISQHLFWPAPLRALLCGGGGGGRGGHGGGWLETGMGTMGRVNGAHILCVKSSIINSFILW